MTTRRIAVVDMGSNSLKYSITEVDETGRDAILHTHADTVRLGAGIRTTGQVAPERMARALESLQFFDQVALVYGCEALLGVATEAVRIASNGQLLLDEITRTTRWQVRVISGDEEARLNFVGALAQLPASGLSSIVDIGGGSTEVIIVRDRAMEDAESIGIGSGTLADATFTADPPGQAAVREAVAKASDALGRSSVVEAARGAALHLSGGNGMFLSELANWSAIAIPFTPDRFPDLLAAIAEMNSERTAAYLEIVPERARMLPAGGAIAQAAVNLTETQSLAAVPSGIRGGVIAEWLAERGSDPDSTEGVR